MLNYQILFCNDSVRYIRYVQETLKNDIVIISLKLHTTIRRKISVVTAQVHPREPQNLEQYETWLQHFLPNSSRFEPAYYELNDTNLVHMFRSRPTKRQNYEITNG